MKNNRLLLDMGPLVIFFAAYKFAGIFWATGLFMVAMVLALGFSWLSEKRLRIMPVITLVLVLFFGSMTLYFQNSTFIKMKPTAIYLLFAMALGGGAAFGQYYLKVVFDGAFEMPDAVWRTLSWRWAAFFVALAVLNELIWRNFSENIWVDFKVFGLLPLTLVFAFANMPLMMKHMRDESAEKSS
ncbi:MAG: septation protein A [Robiginitomaculum sp.]|nr:septation protein A [Robiginitomaculum sp.]MDQ7076463.1 septation protein A [Robiginitomaculum sp.]